MPTYFHPDAEFNARLDVFRKKLIANALADTWDAKFIEYLKPFTENNHPEALFWMAYYSDGKEFKNALIRASEYGSIEAHYDIAKYHLNGEHYFDKNYTLAKSILFSLSDYGYAPAQLLYSKCLHQEYIETGDISILYEEYKWAKKAAEGNLILEDAQVILGGLHEAGQGVPKDRLLALFWYMLAADREQPHKIAQNEVKRLKDFMHPDRIKRASEMVDEFWDEHYEKYPRIDTPDF